MLNNFFAGALGVLFLAMPFAALADTLSDSMDEMRFGLFREAAAQALFDISKPACAVKANTGSVKVNERFVLAWGAWGTIDSESKKNTWVPTGAAIIALSAPGTYVYTFKFYGVGGTETSCETRISVK